MHSRKAHVIDEREWQEIASMRAIRAAWGLDDAATAEQFASQVYGAKFDFVSGSPGYVGDIFVIQGDALTEVPPIVLRRDRDGRLIVC